MLNFDKALKSLIFGKNKGLAKKQKAHIDLDKNVLDHEKGHYNLEKSVTTIIKRCD